MPAPPRLLLDGDAQEAEAAELGPELAREAVGAVDLVRARGDPVGSEIAYRRAQHLGGLAQAEIEALRLVWDHGTAPPGASLRDSSGNRTLCEGRGGVHLGPARNLRPSGLPASAAALKLPQGI